MTPAAVQVDDLYRLLRKAPRDRVVAPSGQQFAFMTHRGKVRKDNQDTALVLSGRHTATSSPFFAAILCDGIGGLEHGDDAAALATATAGSALAHDIPLAPIERMRHAIREANKAVFERFQGRSGTVLAAALMEPEESVIGWVGDARIYAALRGGDLAPITSDDTIAAEIARIEGTEQAGALAMDSLTRAIGQKRDVEPHAEPLKSGYQTLLLVSDGIYRIDPGVLQWVRRHAHGPKELVERLVAAAQWEGGSDNATGIAITMDQTFSLDEDGQVIAAWVEAQPRVWKVVRMESPKTARRPEPARSEALSGASNPTKDKEREADRPAGGKRVPRERPQQAPLDIALDPARKENA
jgi:serine/threonine protein phosphatase PrpC